MWKRMTLGLLLVLLCGCIKTKDELTINADGTGKVRIETQTSIPPELSEGNRCITQTIHKLKGRSVLAPARC